MKATERCDRCNAQAYVLTMHSGNSLLWCKHHFEKYKHYLEPCIYIDARESLSTDATK